jgi:CBS domain-containing protein
MTTIRDILAKKGSSVSQADRNEPVLEAARRMNEHHIGSLVVTEGESVVGIFSERDVLCRVVAAGRDPASTHVGDVMTSPVAVCHLRTRIDECRSVMTSKRIRHMPVVEEGRLIGIITSGDILAAESQVQQETIEYLHQYLYGQTR